MTFYDQKFGNATRPPKAEVIVPKTPVAAAPALKPSFAEAVTKRRGTVAYGALVTFSFLYYARPEDFIPGMAAIPVGKISGGLALAGLILSWGRLKGKMPLAIKLVLVLLVHMCITIPFAFWRGGAYDVVVNQFSKAAMVALLISMIVSSIGELRRLLWVQATAVSVMTIASILVHPSAPSGGSTRLWGLGGVFSNPNDFAINIAINFPLCLAFLLGAKGRPEEAHMGRGGVVSVVWRDRNLLAERIDRHAHLLHNLRLGIWYQRQAAAGYCWQPSVCCWWALALP